MVARNAAARLSSAAGSGLPSIPDEVWERIKGYGPRELAIFSDLLTAPRIPPKDEHVGDDDCDDDSEPGADDADDASTATESDAGGDAGAPKAGGDAGVPSGGASISERKRAANRANAAKSTGPRTAEGKARSARNAVKHGLFAQSPLFFSDDPAELEALGEEILQEYQPVGLVERRLVERLVSLTWRLRRIAAAEEAAATDFCFPSPRRGFFLPSGNPKMTSAHILASTLGGDSSAKLKTLADMDLRFGGQYLATLRQLAKARADRLKQEREMQAAELEGRSGDLPVNETKPPGSRSSRSAATPKPAKADAEPFAWEIEQTRRQEAAAEEAERQGEQAAWKRAIEAARAEGEAAGRAAALNEAKPNEATAPGPLSPVPGGEG